MSAYPFIYWVALGCAIGAIAVCGIGIGYLVKMRHIDRVRGQYRREGGR